MTQEEFDIIQDARRKALKKRKAQLMAQYQQSNDALEALNREFNEGTAMIKAAGVEASPAAFEGKNRKSRECYCIQRHLKNVLAASDKITRWDVANAEVKFNKQDDLLLFEIAIQPTKIEE